MSIRNAFAAMVLITSACAMGSPVVEQGGLELASHFKEKIGPFLQTYCYACHNKDKAKGDVNLAQYTDMPAVLKDDAQWVIALDKLKSGDMPPENAKAHPPAEARQDIINWILGARHFEALRHAGDPGPVLARRLSNAEYDYTIRDLTGVDIQPAKQFPVDPANEAGFDNTGESLTMSPSLLTKYMEGAKKVADYLVLKPNGLDFAPFPMVSEEDGDKYCVNRIIQFYKQQPTDLAEYFLAAKCYEHRQALGQPNAGFDDIAAQQKVSAKYLPQVWAALTDDLEKIGPIAALQAMWRALPVPDAAHLDSARQGCQQMRDLVVNLRKKIRPEFPNLRAPQMQAGSQPLVLWKDRQYADTRFAYAPGSAMKLGESDLAPDTLAAPALAIPEGAAEREQYENAFKRFCGVFPDVFVVTERARIYLSAKSEEKLAGRLLSAGFHSQMGYFRDDGPLYQLILADADRKELDELWKELDYVADAPRRTLQGMMWFERSDSRYMKTTDFDAIRAEDRDILAAPKLKHLKELFLAKAAKLGAEQISIDAITKYFDDMNDAQRWIDQAKIASVPIHLATLQDFAQRAYRRPLSQKERGDIVSFYWSLRNDDHLEHEEAVHETLISILMSPYFCYRVNSTPPGDTVAALSDYELASRLSYFLWSSMPDQELLDHAAAGDLHQPNVLADQTHRLMNDPRFRDFAVEFGGNWLDIRRFDELNSVDRERFPTFDNNLKAAMFEEPVRFILDLARRNGSALDFLYGNYTFVNPVLARHYGIPLPDATSTDEWIRVDDAHRFQRGGLLPMAAFLTKNAPGDRTSPVKRGNWVVRRMLGERVPPPPPNVPVLPADEAKLGDLTLRQALAAHRDDKACASCHVRIDPLGLVFEGFGPIGELRTKDLGGRPVDASTAFPDGSEGAGLQGLQAYLRKSRQDDFVDNLCRKLLSYGLSRNLILSDDITIEQMKAKLSGDGYRFGSLIEAVIASPQFLNKRGQTAVAKG